jgi:hypothetical protein
VQRLPLQLGAQRREIERREKEREDMLAKSTDRTVCFHLIYYKAWLCGRIPRERVNYVYLVLCVIDYVFFCFCYYVISLLW